MFPLLLAGQDHPLTRLMVETWITGGLYAGLLASIPHEWSTTDSVVEPAYPGYARVQIRNLDDALLWPPQGTEPFTARALGYFDAPVGGHLLGWDTF
jgi:hypothetical protein